MYAHRNNIFGTLAVGRSHAEELRLRCDSQSMAYYADVSGFLSQRLLGFETLSLLDVGPRTGAGLALLRLMHHPASFARLKLDPVTGLDIDDSFEAVARAEFPDIEPLTGDVSSIEDKSFDIVMSSHTVEMVADMPSFVRRLESIARRCVVIASVLGEPATRLDGQRNVLTAEVLASMGYLDVEVYDSFHFHGAPCFMAFKLLT